MLSRRNFMLAGLGALGATLTPAIGLATAVPVRLLSPVSREDKHYIASLALVATEPRIASLPMRGHGMQVDPNATSEALIIGRRPGTIAIKIDIGSGQILQQWQAGEDRHFFGHACYSTDGRTLFVTENNIDNGQGMVTVRDAGNFRVLAEYRSHGIGPHEILLMPDGVTLAIANGGIQTLPETGRVKLNRGRIDSSLVYLDSRNGQLLGHYPVPSTQLSLRHLALAPNGRVAAALQFEGDRQLPGTPLLIFHHGETALQFASAPQSDWNQMQHYAASIAFDPASKRFALTCPLGNTVGCWTADGIYAGRIEVPKASGIAFNTAHGFATNELGEVYRLDLANLNARLHAKYPNLQWDNHLYIASA